jgi:type II secretory pathway pseudopilin PulG
MRRLESQSGITYIQILFVVVLAGMISALYVPYLTAQKVAEKVDLTRTRMQRIGEAQEAWYGTHGAFTDQRDSLMTILSDTTAFVDPLSSRRFRIGTANSGQDYSISTLGENPLTLVTEDRWNQFRDAFRVWQAEQTRRLEDEAAAARAARRRPPPR